jgi:thiol peroxidase
MNERKGLVTMAGKPVTLVGHEVKVGDTAPEVELIAPNLQPVKLSSFRGKVLVLSSVPSLDTSICDLETRHFNLEADKLGPEVAMVTVSMDLPFAQKRWCASAGVSRVQTLSDYKEAAFGLAYGVLMRESRLLARVVFVLDKKHVVQYVQVVPEIGKEPDYNAVLGTVRKLL